MREHWGFGRAVWLLWGALTIGLVACGVYPTSLLRPNGITVAPDGTLYVVDRGHYRVVQLTATGQLLDAFGQLGTGADDLYSAWDVAVDAAGQRYVCNRIFNMEGEWIQDGIKVFSPTGHQVQEIGRQSYTEETAMNHNAPTGLAVDEAGRVYVADLGANAVRVFDPQGRLLTRFFGVYGAAAGEFRDLADVAVDSERGLLYAVDSINGRLQQFTLSLDANGVPTVTVRLVVGEYGREPGQFSYPQSVAVDPSSGRVYVADMGNQRIQAFDVEGTYLAAYRPAGVHLWQVMGVAVGADGTLYATDALNNLIWAFDPGGGPPRRIEPHP